MIEVVFVLELYHWVIQEWFNCYFSSRNHMQPHGRMILDIKTQRFRKEQSWIKCQWTYQWRGHLCRWPHTWDWRRNPNKTVILFSYISRSNPLFRQHGFYSYHRAWKRTDRWPFARPRRCDWHQNHGLGVLLRLWNPELHIRTKTNSEEKAITIYYYSNSLQRN